MNMKPNTHLLTVARGMKSHRCYVNAVNKLARFLGREPKMADLDTQMWEKFMEWLPQHGWSEQQQQATRDRLRVLWGRGIAAGVAKPKPPRKQRPNQLQDVEQPERSLLTFFETVYRTHRLRGRSDNSVRLYRFSCRNFSTYLGRPATLDDLTDQNVNGLLCWMADRGLAAHSRQKELSQLTALWRYAIRKRLLEDWPDIQPEKLPQRTPEAWTAADLEKLYRAIREIPGHVAGIPAAAWWEALHRVLACSAERISAVLELRWSDVDLQSGWINFRAASRKGGRADNAIRLNGTAIESLKRIQQPKRELVFEWDRSLTYLWAIYADILKAAGLPHDARSKFHRMRRTVASHFEAAGGNATALLTHSNRKVTLAYLDPRIVKPPQAADLLGDLLEIGS